MAHITEVIRDSYPQARSFLDALYYSDSVSSIGISVDGESIRAFVVNWDENASSELDERISQMIAQLLQNGEDSDEISVYCPIFPATVQYNHE